MKILSVYPWTHISSSALTLNGKIVSASAEERFNRIKWSTEFPNQSANWCLEKNNLQWKDLDMIVVPWNPALNINSTSNRWDNHLFWRGQMLSHVPSRILKSLNSTAPESMEIKFSKTKIIYLNHHDCHAASAVLVSPFKNCDYLSIDGHGETETCISGYFKSNNFVKTNSISYPHSVGLLYGTFTDFLGFKPDNDEWKTMALASYSTKKNLYDEKMKKIYKFVEGGFELDLSYFDFYHFDKKPNFYNEKLVKLFGKPRQKNKQISKRHFQIAGALQRAFEQIVLHLIYITKKLGGNSNNITLVGGAAMNCVFNGFLEQKKIYKNKFIPPWPDDLGVSIGACLLANHKYGRKIHKPKKDCPVYLGPSYTNSTILNLLKKYNLNYSKPNNLFKYVAKKLTKGKLIGWFQDEMEFTHRALGNRSILADPRKAKTKDKVNLAVKYRENFRPFAPAVLEQYAHKIFNIKKNLEIKFMEKAVFVKKKWKNKIPATIHTDGTARVQTVNKNFNKKFYNLISEFNNITGIPVLLNTSFNLNGEPIVKSPTDAIRTFHSCGLDILVLQDYVIEKNEKF
tara:strand:+ start:1488 stop:3197 length:1710 start_codon:yes stop_codon:yes gene_type:complete